MEGDFGKEVKKAVPLKGTAFFIYVKTGSPGHGVKLSGHIDTEVAPEMGIGVFALEVFAPGILVSLFSFFIAFNVTCLFHVAPRIYSRSIGFIEVDCFLYRRALVLILLQPGCRQRPSKPHNSTSFFMGFNFKQIRLHCRELPLFANGEAIPPRLR